MVRGKTREILIDPWTYILEEAQLGNCFSLSRFLNPWPSRQGEGAGSQGPHCSFLQSLKFLPEASSTGMYGDWACDSQKFL